MKRVHIKFQGLTIARGVIAPETPDTVVVPSPNTGDQRAWGKDHIEHLGFKIEEVETSKTFEGVILDLSSRHTEEFGNFFKGVTKWSKAEVKYRVTFEELE